MNHRKPNSGKPRVLAFADANFIAHTSRVVEVAKVLRDRHGYEVIFAGAGAFTSIPKNEGMVTDYVFTVSKKSTLDLARKAGLVNPRWWFDMCRKSILSDLDVIDKHKPDLILGDMHWSLFASAQETGVPYVAIANAHWTDYFGDEFGPLEDHWSYTIFGKHAGKMFPAFRTVLGGYWALPYIIRGLRKNYPRKAKNICDVLAGADLVLLADVPSYGPVTDAPDHYQYCGPILWEPHIAEPAWLGELDPDRPTLYVTMGSTGDPKFFQDTVRSYAATDYQVIVTTGGLPVDFSDMPANVRWTDFAPGHAMMEHADLVISHGGNGTIYQALSWGTPIIGIPFHIDQDINLQRVEALGVGIKLPLRRFSARTLRKAVDTILGDPGYADRARKVREEIRAYGGAETAAQLVEEFARKRGIR